VAGRGDDEVSVATFRLPLTQRRALVLALVLAVVLALQTTVAEAYLRAADAQRGLVMTERPPADLGEVRATLVMDLRANEAGLIQAESQIYQGYPDRNAIGQKITSERADGTIVRESWTGTNLLAHEGLTPLVNRLLFVAPASGTYYCRLRVYVNSHYAQPGRAVLFSGLVGDKFGTLTSQQLALSGVMRGVTLFPAGDRTVRRVVPILRYLPPAGATKIEARADVYLTNCYGPGGAGCPLGSFPTSGSSTYAVQGFLVPTSPACKTVATTRWVRTFDYLKHHIGNNVDISAPIPAGVNCGSWSTYTQVEWLSGLPFVVHLYPYSQASIIAS
jgi:hypothetical protein